MCATLPSRATGFRAAVRPTCAATDWSSTSSGGARSCKERRGRVVAAKQTRFLPPYRLRCQSSQLPPSVGSPRFARGTAQGLVPPASRGEPRKDWFPPLREGNRARVGSPCSAKGLVPPLREGNRRGLVPPASRGEPKGLGSPCFARGTAQGLVPPLREGNRRGLVPPASRGEPRRDWFPLLAGGTLRRGSITVFCELWFGDWY